MEIIFSKYSNERANQFKIRTDIGIDYKNEYAVYKMPLSVEANQHIAHIKEVYTELNEMCKDSIFKVNKYEKFGNGLKFEYIQGKTLQEMLDKYIINENYTGVVELINKYAQELYKLSNKTLFRISEEFREVFGEVNLPSSLRSIEVANIDIIFPNVIVNNFWHIIDYEWTFKFEVPINYIIYRAISCYTYTSDIGKRIGELGLYKLLGIKDLELLEYEQMENSFRLYILGNTVSSTTFYQNIRTQKNTLESILIEHNKKIDSNYKVQVFYDYGNGFSEENSQWIQPIKLEENSMNLMIDNLDRVKTIRIDPSEKECIIAIDGITAFDEKYYEVETSNNGFEIDLDVFLFTNKDPQLIVSKIKSGTKKIEVVFQMREALYKEVVGISKLINKAEKLAVEKEVALAEKVVNLTEKEIYKVRLGEIEATKKIVIDELQHIVEEQEGIIGEQKHVLEEQEGIIGEQKHVVENQKRRIEEQKLIINNQAERIYELETIECAGKRTIETLEISEKRLLELNKNSEETSEDLERKLEEQKKYINEIQHTKVWKMYRWYKKILKSER